MRFAWTFVLGVALVGCGEKKPTTSAADAASQSSEQTAQPVAPSTDYAREISSGIALLTRNNPADDAAAVTRLKAGLKGIDDPNGWFNLGVAYSRIGQHAEALAAFEKAVELAPGSEDAQVYLARARAASGDSDAAIKQLRAGLKKTPDAIALHEELVAQLLAAGKTRDTVEAAKAALQVNTGSLAVYNNMGVAYREMGELDLAQFVFQKAELLPGADTNPLIQANLGWTLHLMGERGPARTRLSKAVELDRTSVPALVFLASLYLNDHNYQDAVPLLETAAKEAPENYAVHMNLGVAYRGVANYGAAKTEYTRAAEIDPEASEPIFNLAILLGDYMKQYDDAIAMYERYKRQGGERVDEVDEYIKLLEREKKRAERRRKKEAERAQRAKEREAEQKNLEEQRAAGELNEEAPAEEAPAAPADPAPSEEGGGASGPWGDVGEAP